MASQEVLISPGAGGYTARRIAVEDKKKLLSILESASDNAASVGASDGDLLIALGKCREWYDPFGIFCGLYGNMMKVFGPLITTLVSLVSLVLFIDWAVTKIENIWNWFTSLASSLPIRWVKGGFESMFFQDGSGIRDESLAQMSALTFAGMVTGFLPPPVAGALAGIRALINGTGSPVQGPPSAGSGILGAVAGAAANPSGTLENVAETALEKVLGLLVGKDQVFSDEETQEMAQLQDLSQEQLAQLLHRIRNAS